jgi:hypothetical protein
MSINTDSIEKAIKNYLTGKLAQFRTTLEGEAGQPICEIELDGTLLLSDICRFLGLDEQQYNQVLGENGVQYVSEVFETRVWVRSSLLPVPSEAEPAMAER